MYAKGYLMNQKSHFLSVLPQKASLGRRKNYITVLKTGYLVWDIIEYEKVDSSKMNFNKKESFLFNPVFIQRFSQINLFSRGEESQTFSITANKNC